MTLLAFAIIYVLYGIVFVYLSTKTAEHKMMVACMVLEEEQRREEGLRHE